MTTLLGILLALTALFLILLVLVQRGRGGGLAGALGGAGGQSAFGTKAGDTFTKVTIATAAFWIILCMVSIKLIGGGTQSKFDELGGPLSTMSSGESEDEDSTGETDGTSEEGTGEGESSTAGGSGEEAEE